MKELKIRSSNAFKIMTSPKTKADKESGVLSQTAKTYLKELFLSNVYGFSDPVMTDEMMKGLLCEQSSFELVQTVLGGEFRFKNTTNYQNDYLTGTPDIVLKDEDIVEDIKTSWNLRTFFLSTDQDEILKAYYWQLLSYMALTGKRHARLIYCLINTPGEIVSELIKRVYFKFGCDDTNETYNQMADQIEKNHRFDSIPAEKRIKVFEFDYSQDDYEKLIGQIEKARIYYNTLSL